MPLIDWRKDYELGIGAIDHEHRELIELINEMHAALGGDASPEAAVNFLGELYTQVSGHFALEERMMRDAGYDEVEAHREEHEELLDSIRELMDAYGEDASFDFRPSPEGRRYAPPSVSGGQGVKPRRRISRTSSAAHPLANPRGRRDAGSG